MFTWLLNTQKLNLLFIITQSGGLQGTLSSHLPLLFLLHNIFCPVAQTLPIARLPSDMVSSVLTGL